MQMKNKMSNDINGAIVNGKVYVLGETGKDCRYCDLCDVWGKCLAPWFTRCGFDENDCGHIFNYSKELTNKLNK